MPKLIFFFLTFSVLLFQTVFACESCTIPNLGRGKSSIESQSEDKKWYFEYLFEQQNWKELPSAEAHNLHENGHHIHNKSLEHFHHFTFGNYISDQLSASAEIPFIIRESLEIEDHNRLGDPETSHGWGDLTLTGDYRVHQNENTSIGIIGGIKFPTGMTKELNSAGEKFEPELQPGTGSFDYILGSVYQVNIDRFKILSNIAYVFKLEGSLDYRFGDLLSSSLFVEYTLNPKSQNLKTDIGLNVNIQYEQKHKENGLTVADSGGTSLFLGPIVSVATTQNTQIYGSILFPLHQDLGGVHQELESTWTAGGRISF